MYYFQASNDIYCEIWQKSICHYIFGLGSRIQEIFTMSEVSLMHQAKYRGIITEAGSLTMPPSMVMMVFMGLYTIIDTIFVARFVDTNALFSINIVCPVINILVGLGTMLATGGSAIVAKKWGAEIQKKLEVTLRSSLLQGAFQVWLLL